MGVALRAGGRRLMQALTNSLWRAAPRACGRRQTGRGNRRKAFADMLAVDRLETPGAGGATRLFPVREASPRRSGPACRFAGPAAHTAGQGAPD